MKQLRNVIPLLLLLAAFTYSVWQVFGHGKAAADPDRITIRVGHWLLHAGMRESFDEAARAYEKLHPDVTIEQIAVPLRSWNAWMRTQLIGGTAPDLTGLLSANEEIVSRHFIPITDRIEEPNPYNVGTPLEGIPWRNTFADGLDGVRNICPTSSEIAGVNLQLTSLRLFYNKALLKTITGSDVPPATFAELLATSRTIADFNQRHNTRYTPVAGCGPYAQYFFERTVPSQTQQLVLSHSPMHRLNLLRPDLAHLFLAGELDYHTPQVRSALNLLREVTSVMTPGFNQLQRDDALFAYLQGHAVMIVAGTWDYAVFVRDGEFETGVVPIPIPSTDDPDYGRYSLGPIAESGGIEAQLGITRYSQHPEVALDFLRFLSSYPMAEMFTENTLRMSALIGIPPPKRAPGLATQTEGEIPGFNIDFQHFGGNHTFLLFQRHLHTLLGPQGDVDAFVRDVSPHLKSTLRKDMAHHLNRTQRDVQRLDALVGILYSHPDPDASGSLTRLLEAQHERHAEILRHTPLLTP